MTITKGGYPMVVNHKALLVRDNLAKFQKHIGVTCQYLFNTYKPTGRQTSLLYIDIEIASTLRF